MEVDTLEKKTETKLPKFAIKMVSNSPPQWQVLIWSPDFNQWSICSTYQTHEVALMAMRAKALNQPMSAPPAEFFDEKGEPVPEHPRRRFY